MSLASRLASTAVALAAATSLMAAPASAIENAPIASDALSNTAARVTADVAGGAFVCTGAAISPTVILTARHCTTQADPTSVTAPDGTVIPVTGFTASNKSDLAVLKLGRTWTGDIARTSVVPARAKSTFAAYGMGGDENNTLRVSRGVVTIPVSSNTSMSFDGQLLSPLMGETSDGSSWEHGDSGGPVVNNNGEIIGVISGASATGFVSDKTMNIIGPLSVDAALLTNAGVTPVVPSQSDPTPSVPGTIIPNPSDLVPGSNSPDAGSSLDAGSIIGIITAVISLLGALGGLASQFGLI